MFSNYISLVYSTLDFKDLPVHVEVSEEQAVDKSGLAKSGLAHHHEREVESSLHRLTMHLLRQCREPDVVTLAFSFYIKTFSIVNEVSISIAIYHSYIYWIGKIIINLYSY